LAEPRRIEELLHRPHIGVIGIDRFFADRAARDRFIGHLGSLPIAGRGPSELCYTLRMLQPVSTLFSMIWLLAIR
jgi:hypothetical protein